MIGEDSVISYFTGRRDGNLSFSRDSSPENVRERFGKIARELKIDYKFIVCGRQTHGCRVGLVTEEHRGTGISRPLAFDETDALITCVPGIVLCTIHADCIPVQFWDPVHRAVGAAHSGWKGTLGEIASRVTEKMAQCFGTQPKDLIAAIGPGICQECFEISLDVFQAFQDKFPSLVQRENFVKPGRTHNKWQLNLKAFIYESLLASGLPPQNISVSQDCTCCREDLYFSHRRDSLRPVTKGAMASLIALRPEK